MNLGIAESLFGDSAVLWDAIAGVLIIIGRILFAGDLADEEGEGSISISTSTITAKIQLWLETNANYLNKRVLNG